MPWQRRSAGWSLPVASDDRLTALLTELAEILRERNQGEHHESLTHEVNSPNDLGRDVVLEVDVWFYEPGSDEPAGT